MGKLHKHPALWSKDQDMHFLVDLIAREASTGLSGPEDVVKGKNWASNPIVQLDVSGKAPYWPEGSSSPTYDTTCVMNIGRYYRNKALHFNGLHPDLKEVFGRSIQGLRKFCDEQVTTGDLIFTLWLGVNGHLAAMKDY